MKEKSFKLISLVCVFVLLLMQLTANPPAVSAKGMGNAVPSESILMRNAAPSTAHSRMEADATGGRQACALATAEGVNCWSSNYSRQAGNPSTTGSPFPGALLGDTLDPAISGNAGVAGVTLNYTGGSTTSDGSGNYSINVASGWSGTVTPSIAGYTFSPPYKDYINVTADISGENYTAIPLTFTISGSAGVGGATLSYTDGTPKTVTADGSGNYNFTVSYNWSGTVTPSKAGYTFSPINRAYTNVLADQTAQDYTATAIIFTISGSAGVGGATLSYTDGTPKTVTAESSGNYILIVSYNWSGTVTPSMAGYTFSPPSRTYTNVLSSLIAQNYTATAITFTISGSAGVGGATLNYTDGTPKTVTADGLGNYTLTVSHNWSGTVTPTKVGYTFLPASRTYTNVLANQTAQDYTATPTTFTISGSAGVAGATLSYTDGTPKTVTADGGGNYILPVSYNWSGTVTPSLTGYTFSPPSLTYTNLLANQSAQNYVATAITLTISGSAGVAGATLSYTDVTPKTVTADISGNYTLTVSYNWSGTVTPSMTGYTFSPINRAYTNVLANQTAQNYTATAIAFTISGSAGVGGATLSYTDVTPKTVTADGTGNYTLTVSYNWSGTVTPTKVGYTFLPISLTYTNVLANQTAQNYVATGITFTISGSAGVAGATLSYTDVTPKTVTADGTGIYTLTVSYNWTGTVTPTKVGYTFLPISLTYTNVLANQTAQNYTATAITYTIAGSAGVSGATLSFTDVTPKTVTADGTGNYTLTVSYNWSGTVTPTKVGYTFSPPTRTYTNVLANQTAQNYTAIPITYTISGATGVNGTTLSYTDGTPKTVNADGDGNYSLIVSYNWSGTVTPSKTGYIFSPPSRAYTNVLANQTAQNYTASVVLTISGSAGVDGAILSYTDGTPKTVTADGSGNYSLTVSYNWSGIVTPSKGSCVFTPPSTQYINITTNRTGQNYSANCPPPPPTLIAPSGTIVAIYNPTYTWYQVAGSTGYYLWVDGPSGPVIKKYYTSAQANCNGTTCSVTPITSLAEAAYTWWVCSYNWLGYGLWSPGMNFTVANAAIPGAATLVSPSGSIGANYNPTYTWNQVANSTYYQLSVDGPSTNVILQWYTSAQANCNGTTCSVTPTTMLLGGAYTWKIQTWSPAGYGPWSTPMSFSVTIPIIPVAATLVSPSGSIGANYNPTYTWNKVANSTYYQLSVDVVPSGNVIRQWYTSAQANCNSTTCSVTPATSLAGGAYTWTIQTWNPAGYGPWSTPMSFNATIPTIPGAATLVSPSGSIGANYNPTYTWNQVANSTYYQLSVDGPSGNVILQWYTSAQANCNGSTCSVIPTTTLAGGAYTWKIQTWNQAGNGPWSTPMSFSAGIPGAAVLISPSGDIGATKKPTYTWNQVTNSTWYQLSVDGPSGNVILQWYTSAQANCNGTTCSVTPATSLVSGAYTWKIQTCSSAGYGPWSTQMGFSVTIPPTPVAATLVSPSGSIGASYNPAYTWNQVSNATWYLLQVNKNSPNTNVIYQWYTPAQANCNGTTCSITPATTLGVGAYTWWILTNNSGGDGLWSSGMNFSTTSPSKLGPATQVSPTGSSTNHSPTYTWNQVTGSTYYLLQVNGPSGTVVYQWYTLAQSNCNGTTCSVTPLPPLTGGAYTWWVLTYNAAGDGTWSSGMGFTVSP